MTTEREKFLTHVFEHGNDKEYGFVSGAFQIADKEIDALRAELEQVKRIAQAAYSAWQADMDSKTGKLLRSIVDEEFRKVYIP